MKKIITPIILFFLIAPLAVNGQGGLVPCGGEGNPCQLCHLFELFANVIEFLLVVVVPPVAALLFIWGGIRYYTSMGDPSNALAAKKILISVVIGIAIIYSAHFFVSMILSALGVADVQWPNINICS